MNAVDNGRGEVDSLLFPGYTSSRLCLFTSGVHVSVVWNVPRKSRKIIPHLHVNPADLRSGERIDNLLII